VLQLNFPRALTNAGGTIPLAIDPNVAYSAHCVDNIPALCTPPPANISQEQFGMPPNVYTGTSSFYFRVIVTGLSQLSNSGRHLQDPADYPAVAFR
jgi:hypothetical protein